MTARKGRARPRIALHPEQRRDLAKYLGVHPGTLSGYLTGSSRPSFRRAVQLLLHPSIQRSGLCLEDLVGHLPPNVRVWSWETDAHVAERVARAAAAEADRAAEAA